MCARGGIARAVGLARHARRQVGRAVGRGVAALGVRRHGVAGQQVLAVAAVDDVIAGRGSRQDFVAVERRRRGGLVVGLGNIGIARLERVAGEGVLNRKRVV